MTEGGGGGGWDRWRGGWRQAGREEGDQRNLGGGAGGKDTLHKSISSWEVKENCSLERYISGAHAKLNFIYLIILDNGLIDLCMSNIVQKLAITDFNVNEPLRQNLNQTLSARRTCFWSPSIPGCHISQGQGFRSLTQN